jgi:hypothetical protein
MLKGICEDTMFKGPIQNAIWWIREASAVEEMAPKISHFVFSPPHVHSPTILDPITEIMSTFIVLVSIEFLIILMINTNIEIQYKLIELWK